MASARQFSARMDASLLDRLERRGARAGMNKIEDRALVTDNQRDFIPIHRRRIASGQDHTGLILTTNRRFPRGQPATTGKLVVALDHFLHSTAPAIVRSPSFIDWLQESLA
jgi:hypothetical protein